MGNTSSDQPADVSAALATMERISKLPPMTYVPQWLRSDRDEPWRPERDSHVMVQLDGRLYESHGCGSVHRV